MRRTPQAIIRARLIDRSVARFATTTSRTAIGGGARSTPAHAGQTADPRTPNALTRAGLQAGAAARIAPLRIGHTHAGATAVGARLVVTRDLRSPLSTRLTGLSGRGVHATRSAGTARPGTRSAETGQTAATLVRSPLAELAADLKGRIAGAALRARRANADANSVDTRVATLDWRDPDPVPAAAAGCSVLAAPRPRHTFAGALAVLADEAAVRRIDHLTAGTPRHHRSAALASPLHARRLAGCWRTKTRAPFDRLPIAFVIAALPILPITARHRRRTRAETSAFLASERARLFPLCLAIVLTVHDPVQTHRTGHAATELAVLESLGDRGDCKLHRHLYGPGDAAHR
jgi:hypothetical protein